MGEEKQTPFGDMNVMNPWFKSAVDFWGGMLRGWVPETDAQYKEKGASADGKAQKSRAQESLEAVLKTLTTLSSAGGEPEGIASATHLAGILPEITLKLMQASLKGFSHFQQQWMERATRISNASSAYSFDNLNSETIRFWSETYQNEFSRFFSVPQLGLTRFYQERLNQSLDKVNRFQVAFTEFIDLFMLPVEKTLNRLQEEISRMAAENKLPDNQDAYYKIWIKILEGQYITLLKSPEYVETMRRTLDALEQFMASRDAVLQDMLKAMSVPTQKEMDELYREIYLMKKRIRKLEQDAGAGHLES
ncbi:MAG: hypothetical protein KFF50_17485 [Desulfatitalea sp.]|nr:hypothetical protein [Desulfatitalea sp.]